MSSPTPTTTRYGRKPGRLKAASFCRRAANAVRRRRALFRIRYRDGVTREQRILWNDDPYDILMLVDVGAARQTIEILAVNGLRNGLNRMSDGITVQLQGIDELKRALEQVPDKLKKIAQSPCGPLVTSSATPRVSLRQSCRRRRHTGRGKLSAALSLCARRSSPASAATSACLSASGRCVAHARIGGAAGAKNPNDPLLLALRRVRHE